MKQKDDTKQLKTYRLSPTAVELLNKLSQKLSHNRTSLIETAVRLLAKQEGISLE